MKRGLLIGLISMIFLAACNAPEPTSLPRRTQPLVTPEATPTSFLYDLFGLNPLPAEPAGTPSAPLSVPGGAPVTTPAQETAPVSPPAYAAVCPPANAGVKLVIPEDGFGRAPDLGPSLLPFLNQGGTFTVLNQALANARGAGYDGNYRGFRLVHKDLTGDGVPEWVIVKYGQMFVYTCADGAYLELLEIYGGEGSSRPDPQLVSTDDMNGNGISELVFATFPCLGECVNTVILEWDGSQLASRLPGGSAGMIGTRSLRVRDLEGDGLRELVMRGNVPRQLYDLYNRGPFREETRVYRWDGQQFALSSVEFAPAHYRFETVQDGDRAFLRGDYRAAIGFYQTAIASGGLDWWSAARRQYNLERLNPDPQAPAPVLPPEDPLERTMLDGYARLRLVMAYQRLGLPADADMANVALQERHPAGSPGAVYAELTSLFLETQRAGQDACAALTERIRGREAEVFGYVGDIEGDLNAYHGDQSLLYQAESICK